MDLTQGDVFEVALLGEQWAMYRDDGGAAHVVSANCAHRGTPLRFGTVRGDGIECLHHGFVYDANGQCPELGAHIRALPIREKYGLVFAYLGDGEPPPLEFASLEHGSDHWVAPPEVWPCPFFIRLENTLDIAHVGSAHRYSGIAGAMSSLEYRMEAVEAGLRLHLEVGGTVVYSEPNRLQFPVPVSDALGWVDVLCFRVPLDNDRCISFSVAAVPAGQGPSSRPRKHPHEASTVAKTGEQIIRGEQRLADIAGTENLTEIEDYVMLVSTHREGRGIEHLAPFDAPIRLLRKQWANGANGER